MSGEPPVLLQHATRDLARFAAGLRYEDLPPEVVERAKLCLLDGLGVCLQGALLPWTRMVQEVVEAEGGVPAASLWGTGLRGSLSQAVLVNSTAGHGFEMDDIHKESILHPNSLTTPIALGWAEAEGAVSGRELLAAIVAGYEVGTRVGNAATMALFLDGFHPQGTSGTFVAAATAGRLRGLDAGRMQHALGIAGSMAAGLMAAQEGAMVKRLHAGRAAQSGVLAAALAARGFTGITEILEAGYGGYLSSFSSRPVPEKLTAGLGESWETLNVGFKMYPTVTSIHTALDALRQLMAAHGFPHRDIARVDVGMGHMTYVHTAWPYRPAGITAAQMNLSFGLAVTALGGTVTAGDFTEERLRDPGLLDFIARVHAHEDSGIEAMGAPFRHACRMTVTLRDGATHSHEELNRRGSPENPVSFAEIEAKFRGNVSGILTDREADQVVSHVSHFERLSDCGELLAILSADRRSFALTEEVR
ncbi:MmgE/PrpD family protein [Pararoseomonas indoligenes]|uniref:MmgE/PrpD family protein n=1 Tax=Roseomonas indoligenes TaxID=2820811 RepID=A0A940N236_9PROT|nr:MmgE/PrpD family protein [Pararoseomonas indoligenes]MBP0495159.1 MmgE/PrpD family protein [Pararoseomonas indoligenes]